jgi:hypothetical protein
MSQELKVNYQGTRPVYVTIRRADGQILVISTLTFEPYDATHYVSYALFLTDSLDGLYTGDMPAIPANDYDIYYSEQAGSFPAPSDYRVIDSISWSGTFVLPGDLLAYATIGETDAYFLSRLHNTDWVSADDPTKRIALAEATRIIDRLAFSGYKTSDAQSLEFPRNGSTLIPQAIKDATAEIAIALLSGIDPEREMRGLRVTSRRFSSVGTTYDARNAPVHILAGVPSATAWGLLLPYLADRGSVIVRRVS